VAKTQQPSPPHLYFFEFFLFTRRAAFGVCWTQQPSHPHLY
jgi:hypothetical protein